MTPSRPQWKPPLWLLGIDLVAVVLLGLGLFMQYNPEAPLATGPLAVLRLPMLIAGGALFLFGAITATRLVLAHQRGRS